MLKQYNAVGFIGNPYVVTYGQVEAAIVGKTSIGIIIAFRGTLKPSLTTDSILDWLQDLFFIQSPAPPYITGEVHSGYLLAVSLLEKGIKEALDDLDPSQEMDVYITGHSKGGGMAPIASMLLFNKYKINLKQTVIFAGPNPGNKTFCDAYNTMFPSDLRYQNYLDIIPLLPFPPEGVEAVEAAYPNMPELLEKILNYDKSLDYLPVATLMYIDSNFQVTKESSSESYLTYLTDLLAISNAIKNGNIGDVLSAHHSGCGYGYMNGTCQGTVCAS